MLKATRKLPESIEEDIETVPTPSLSTPRIVHIHESIIPEETSSKWSKYRSSISEKVRLPLIVQDNIQVFKSFFDERKCIATSNYVQCAYLMIRLANEKGRCAFWKNGKYK